MPRMAKKTHGGKREGAGRKPALMPVHTKKFRATETDWEEFLSFLSGDAEKDFLIVLAALRICAEKEKE